MAKAITHEDLEALKKKYDEMGKEIDKLEKADDGMPWRAEEDEEYFIIDDGVDVIQEREDGVPYDDANYARGNYYKSRELAEAVLALNIHIRQFPMPRIGDDYYVHTIDNKFVNTSTMSLYEEATEYTLFGYQAGIRMSLKTKATDRNKRIKLLSAVLAAHNA